MSRSSPSSIGVLFSGGLDSAIAVGHLLSMGFRVQPIYVSSGLIWEDAEQRAVNRYLLAVASPLLGELTVLQMPVEDIYGDHWSVTGLNVPDADSPDEAVYLPGRNPLLVLKALLWCQLQHVPKLALGCLGSNPFSDGQADFLSQFAALLNHATESNVEVVLPFASLTKRQTMDLGRDLPLQHTFSCISPIDGKHCGRCNKCAERQHAFRIAEMCDPTRYATSTTANAAQ